MLFRSVLTGAIPIAVFDAAMQQFKDAALAERFFTMFAGFEQLPCLKRILQHVADYLNQNAPQSAQRIACNFRLRMLNIHPTSPEFPLAFAEALELLASASESQKSHIAEVVIRQVLSFLLVDDAENIEATIRKVLLSRLRFWSRVLEEAADKNGNAIVKLAESLRKEGKKTDAEFMIRASIKQWGANEELQQLHSSLDT